MSQTNSQALSSAVEFVVSAYSAGNTGGALCFVAEFAARMYQVPVEDIKEGVRAHLKEQSQPAPKAQPISERQQALKEYNSGKVSFSGPKEIARPNVDGLKVPACPKCGGEMHAFFAKDGREFWGCCDRKCRGIRRLVRPATLLTEDAPLDEVYAFYLK